MAKENEQKIMEEEIEQVALFGEDLSEDKINFLREIFPKAFVHTCKLSEIKYSFLKPQIPWSIEEGAEIYALSALKSSKAWDICLFAQARGKTVLLWDEEKREFERLPKMGVAQSYHGIRYVVIYSRISYGRGEIGYEGPVSVIEAVDGCGVRISGRSIEAIQSAIDGFVQYTVLPSLREHDNSEKHIFRVQVMNVTAVTETLFCRCTVRGAKFLEWSSLARHSEKLDIRQCMPDQEQKEFWKENIDPFSDRRIKPCDMPSQEAKIFKVAELIRYLQEKDVRRHKAPAPIKGSSFNFHYGRGSRSR